MADKTWENLYPTIKQQQFNTGTPSYEGIEKILTTPRTTYTQATFPAILPLLQPGVDPYLQEAINSIVTQAKRGKETTLSDITTAAQQRGITGSSIEMGDIAQASRLSEEELNRQISGLVSQDQINKRNQLSKFLQQAYGIDVAQANQLAENLAQLMGQEMGRQTQLELGRMGVKQAQASQPGFFEQVLPSVISSLPFWFL